MVHVRLNERESNPNKYINFISVLPAATQAPHSEGDARELLRALAAQVRPVMKDHGFAVNRLEEYEYNRVFAGRNWCAGEVIELVLRRTDGTFEPIPWLIGTLCHELAHNKHMNHGPAFQRLWTQLRNEVEALQNKGYYGDGYWSSGTRLSDSARVGGPGVEEYDLPEYICGGAQTGPRPKSLGRRRRRRRAVAGPSSRSGAQVEKKRKPGSRVTAQGKFMGEGKSLAEDVSDEEVKAKGSGFRKQANSKRAREERALAAEKRLKTLQGSSEVPKPEPQGSDDDDDDEEDTNVEPETDEMRRRTMRDVTKDNELEGMRSFMVDFLAKSGSSSTAEKRKGKSKALAVIELSSNDGDDETSARKIDAATSMLQGGRAAKLKKTHPSPPLSKSSGARETLQAGTFTGLGNLVRDEMDTRKKESLGMIGGRKLGSQSSTLPSQVRAGDVRDRKDEIMPTEEQEQEQEHNWTCLVCTLDNIPIYLACAACNTPRSEFS